MLDLVIDIEGFPQVQPFDCFAISRFLFPGVC